MSHATDRDIRGSVETPDFCECWEKWPRSRDRHVTCGTLGNTPKSTSLRSSLACLDVPKKSRV